MMRSGITRASLDISSLAHEANVSFPLPPFPLLLSHRGQAKWFFTPTSPIQSENLRLSVDSCDWGTSSVERLGKSGAERCQREAI